MTRQNLIYRIYIGHRCVYIGTTTGGLTNTLRMHFMGAQATTQIDIERVSKIEYAILQSQADCLVYKAYYVNLIKPIYNKSDKARDVLSESVILPELNFIEYKDPIMDKWKEMYKTEQFNLFDQ